MVCVSCGAAGIEGVAFCAACGTKFQSPPAKKVWSKVVLSLVFSLAPFSALVVFWGFANILLSGSEMPEGVAVFNSVILPILFSFSFLCIPLGIVFAIYFALQGKGK